MTFRSQEMAHYRLAIPRQSAYVTVERLVSLELAHLVDLGSPLSRRIDEALQKIQIMTAALKLAGLTPQQFNLQEDYMGMLEQVWTNRAKKLNTERVKLVDYIEAQVNEHWSNFMEMRARLDKLQQNKQSLIGRIACYEAIKECLGNSEALKGVAIIVGVLPPAAELKLSKTIYRISRGYACYRTYQNFKFAGLSDFGLKVVLLLYPTSEGGVLARKLTRVMETFCTSIYASDQANIDDFKRNEAEYAEVNGLIQLSEHQLAACLDQVKKADCAEQWKLFLWRERLIYETLNRMESREHFLLAQLYVPKQHVQKLSKGMSLLQPAPSIQQLSLTRPPTAFNRNAYTNVAQQITDTYGVPRYQEVNPSMFTAVTFPFFFGVMFGDIAHGMILLVLGLVLVFKDAQIRKSSLAMASQMRYMMVMMGFFSVFCGFIYNDFLGLHLNLFGSCYPVPPPLDQFDAATAISAKIYILKDCVYPFGVDPAWGRANNELVFVNSLKMKISVVIAILHMTVGVCIKAANSRYFKKRMDFYFEFIPQILFLVLLFGYMDFLIFFKWLKVWTDQMIPISPSIISTMMGIGLKMGATEVNGNMWGESENTSQDLIQLAILLVAVLCVPIMLLPKPIIQIRRMKQKHQKVNPLLLKDELEEGIGEPLELLEPEEDASQIFVHQLIETIEFVLGTVSNTASYLRLWALSLAHSQLAKVFFDKSMKSAYEMQPLFGVLALPIMFYLLCWVTFGVLMCMDTMECFLHALRLHWVEFQNKFYKGDGYKYDPVSVKAYVFSLKETAAA